jgi:hypothetical protein
VGVSYEAPIPKRIASSHHTQERFMNLRRLEKTAVSKTFT